MNTVKLDDIDADLDPLVNYNAGLGDGIELGLNNAWVKFDIDDRSTWPELDKSFIALTFYHETWYGCDVRKMYKCDDGLIRCFPAWGIQKPLPSFCYWTSPPKP